MLALNDWKQFRQLVPVQVKSRVWYFSVQGSAYDDAIRIDANSIDDLFAIRTAYARYYFMTTLRAVGEINVAKIDLAGIYQVYFFKSYRGEGQEGDGRTTVGKWVNALWKARGRVGKVATDRVLFIGVTRSALIVSIRDSGSYVRNVVGAGFEALANDNETHSFIDGILREYALMPNKQ